jgi:hypothetical protein
VFLPHAAVVNIPECCHVAEAGVLRHEHRPRNWQGLRRRPDVRLFIGLSLCEVAGNITVQLNCDLFENQEQAIEAAIKSAYAAHPDGQVIGSGGAQVSDDTVQKAAALLHGDKVASAEHARLQRFEAFGDATGMAADLRITRALLRVYT